MADSELHHRLRPMSGRDPHEQNRTATPTELIYDLAVVVAFGVASSQTAHLLAEGHYRSAIIGFAMAIFTVCWAWINYTWFSSAYDTDDWFVRLATMVQMVGVLILALGLPDMFHALETHQHFSFPVVVSGYVVMRVALVALWLRAARHDPARRHICLGYAKYVTVAQIGWVLLSFFQPAPLVGYPIFLMMIAVELLGPYLIEGRGGQWTPWHPHHVAERYSLLALIALGESIVGTNASLRAAIDHLGWGAETIELALAGITLTFGLWWVYFLTPSGDILHARPDRAFLWGYGHFFIYAAIGAVGAGLHVAALLLAGESHLSHAATVATVAIPTGLFGAMSFWLFRLLVPATKRRLNSFLVVAFLAVLGVAVAAAALGLPLGLALMLVALAPWVIVVGFEAIGYRHMGEAIQIMLKAHGEQTGHVH